MAAFAIDRAKSQLENFLKEYAKTKLSHWTWPELRTPREASTHLTEELNRRTRMGTVTEEEIRGVRELREQLASILDTGNTQDKAALRRLDEALKQAERKLREHTAARARRRTRVPPTRG